MEDTYRIPRAEVCKPFLRWAGGKTRSLPFLVSHLPRGFPSIDRYYEPFLGGGSLFFHLQPRKAVLSDSNAELMACYEAVQHNPDLVCGYLGEHRARTSKDYFYEARHKYNNSKQSISRSALFVYLNKTCFNGIWRVNLRGEFNVPYGFKEPPHLPSREDLRRASQALANAELSQMDYRIAVTDAGEGDFVYFDPPYPPLNGTSNFTHYTKERFTREDHQQLSQLAKQLARRGCYVLISNSNNDFIRSLYEVDFNIFEIEVTRWIRTDGHRYKVKEIAITNYRP